MVLPREPRAFVNLESRVALYFISPRHSVISIASELSANSKSGQSFRGLARVVKARDSLRALGERCSTPDTLIASR